jgi:hypothetical protein
MADMLCYKPEGHGLEFLWGNWIFSVFLILPATPLPWGFLSL